jgi:hypothetical protein
MLKYSQAFSETSCSLELNNSALFGVPYRILRDAGTEFFKTYGGCHEKAGTNSFLMECDFLQRVCHKLAFRNFCYKINKSQVIRIVYRNRFQLLVILLNILHSQKHFIINV